MWDPRAIVVVILASAISLAHLIAIAGMAWWGKSLTEVGGDVLIALVGAMIAIVAGYIGQPTSSKPKDDVDKDGET